MDSVIYEANDNGIDPKQFQDIRAELTSALEQLGNTGTRKQTLRAVMLDILMKSLDANPYQNPPDIQALKSDLWFLYEVESRSSFMIEQLQKAITRAEMTSDE